MLSLYMRRRRRGGGRRKRPEEAWKEGAASEA